MKNTIHKIILLGLLFIGIFAGESLAQQAPKRIAIIQNHAFNVTSTQIKQAEMGLRLALEQSQIFRVLLQSEVQELYLKKGILQPSSCIVANCYKDFAHITNTSALLSFALSKESNQLFFDIILHSNTGDLIEHVRYSTPTTDIPMFVRTATAQWLGIAPPPQATLAIPSPLPKAPAYAKWASGAIALGSIYALAAWQHGGTFLFSDHNDLDSNFVYAKDGSVELSGIPGFFFGSPAPNARSRAMGRSGVALLSNPAGLSQLIHSEVNFATARLASNAGQQFTVDWNSPLRPGIWWGLGMRFEGDDLASEMAFQSAFALDFSLVSKWLQGMNGGVNFRALTLQAGQGGTGYARSTGNALGASFDLGLQWTLWDGPKLGAMIRDIWSVVYYHNTLTNQSYQEDLPSTLMLGLAWTSPFDLLFSMDLAKGILPGQSDRLMLGLEQDLYEVVKLRAGMHRVLQNQFTTYSIGGGLHVQQNNLLLRLDLAYEFGAEPYNAIVGEQIMSLSVEFTK